KWSVNPVITSVQNHQVAVWDIPFPAVTFCNQNKYQYSKLFELASKKPNRDEVIRRYGTFLESAFSADEILDFADYDGSASDYDYDDVKAPLNDKEIAELITNVSPRGVRRPRSRAIGW
ncbi:unnamed protein product, partial [Darwinula stevensoni]